MRRALTLLLALTLLGGCGGTGSSDTDEGLTVAATTTIWGDVVSQIVGDDATVEVLIPAGADAHDYQPTPQEVAVVQEADLVVANGLGLEEGLGDILTGAVADGVELIEVAPELEPLEFGHESHEEHDDHADDEGTEEEAGEGGHDHDLDPHVWFDPLRVAAAADLIAARLAEIEPSVDWQARADEYRATLEDLDMEITDLLSSVPESERKLVTNHEALGYYADRYGFAVIGVVIPGGSTLGDPSSAEMAALVEEIEHEGVDTIFAETVSPTRLADAVAAEVGSDVEVVELYTESLGEPGSSAENLVGMLTVDTERIASALGG